MIRLNTNTLRCTTLAMLLITTLAAAGCRTSDAGLGPNEASEPFDLDTAIKLTRLNLYVYQHLTDFLDGLPFVAPEGYTYEKELITYEWFSGNHTMVGDDPTPILLELTRGDDIYLLFRGSVTPSEWIDDVTMAQRLFSELDDDTWAHEGFVDVYRSVADEMLADVQALVAEHPEGRVFITGHSLGGSLSTLAAVHLVEELGVQPIVYTIASPRVGDLPFRDAYHEKVHTSWRIANINDFVPRYPPSRVSVTRGEAIETREYRHVQAVHELEFGTWVEAPLLQGTGLLELDWDLSTSEDRDNVDFSAVDWDSPSLIENHGICHYFNHLCSMSDDEEACKASSDGQDGCNAVE